MDKTKNSPKFHINETMFALHFESFKNCFKEQRDDLLSLDMLMLLNQFKFLPPAAFLPISFKKTQDSNSSKTNS